jgi:hypothetical protein
MLAEQAISNLVAAALPMRVRAAEAGRHAGGHAEAGMLGHLLALVPGDGPAQLGWQRGDGPGQGIGDGIGGVPC